jgi:hypothetical protein
MDKDIANMRKQNRDAETYTRGVEGTTYSKTEVNNTKTKLTLKLNLL